MIIVILIVNEQNQTLPQQGQLFSVCICHDACANRETSTSSPLLTVATDSRRV